jgi:TPR repeat protein
MAPYFEEALSRARQGGKTWMILPASMAVGLMYDYGYGTAEDDGQALHWYRKAIDSGQWLNVYSYIGRMYRDGRGGVDKDLMQAFRFYVRSCLAGHGAQTFRHAPGGVHKPLVRPQVAYPWPRRQVMSALSGAFSSSG